MNETRQISKNTLKNDKITCVRHHPCLLVGPQHGEKNKKNGGQLGGNVGKLCLVRLACARRANVLS